MVTLESLWGIMVSMEAPSARDVGSIHILGTLCSIFMTPMVFVFHDQDLVKGLQCVLV